MTTTDRAITLGDLHGMSAVLGACQRGARVARVDDAHPDGVRYGTARSVGDQGGAFLHGDADPRVAFVRITWASGFDAFVPLVKLADEHAAGLFVIDPS